MRKKSRSNKLSLHRHVLRRIKTHTAGFVTILLLVLLVGLAILLSGFLKNDFPPPGGTPLSSSFTCCDTGDGDACKPVPGKTLTYNNNGQNVDYGLLKSNVTFAEGNCHLNDSTQKDSNGNPIILNTSDGYGARIKKTECGGNDQDQIWGSSNPNSCVAIPNDEIIYVCVKNCTPNDTTACDILMRAPNAPLTTYGNKDSVYNVYFRLSDLPNIPKVISECVKPRGTQTAGEPTIVMSPQPQRQNLQLQTFKMIAPSGSIPWLSPWCKPAVYLYPENTSFVSVRVNSSEPLTYSDPVYPSEGWGVTANPDGTIYYGIKPYDYLYYETKAADDKINVPTKGFVVEKRKLSELFSNILPRLGLNMRETEQFSDYWSNKLPDSPFYFVGIVPQTNLDSLTSLDIIPKPDSEIRVTLYFKPIEHKINVEPPTIVTPARTGFTVVEWGGIFKKDKDSNFSCFQ